MIPLHTINREWTLFLDRDGVINHEKYKDYIHRWDEFVFYEGVMEALAVFANIFPRIFVVTNQKGVGKGLTRPEDLFEIHQNMQNAITTAGGRIDAIYFCPDLEETSINRKPNPGMGLQAKEAFPAIDFSKTVMVGNTISDMEFGRNLGCYTVFLPTTHPEIDLNDHRIDLSFLTLKAFADELLKQQ